MSAVIALIPARAGSRGCPGKNLRELGGRTLIQRAIMCAVQADIWPVYVTTDIPHEAWERDEIEAHHIERPSELASDTASMLAVVQHALAQIPGDDSDIVCLLQPTQPFRTPEHVRAAIALLQETGADSVVSVVPLPLTHSPEMLCVVSSNGYLCPTNSFPPEWSKVPTRRQTARQYYLRDGTVYAFRRKTVTQHGTIYGNDVRPLILDPSETCELDTEADWAAVERRWNQRG